MMRWPGPVMPLYSDPETEVPARGGVPTIQRSSKNAVYPGRFLLPLILWMMPGQPRPTGECRDCVSSPSLLINGTRSGETWTNYVPSLKKLLVLLSI